MWSKPAWWTSPQTHKVAAFSTRVLGNACLRQLKTKAFSDCTKVLFPVGSEWHLGLWPFGSPMNKYANFLVRLPGELEIGCSARWPAWYFSHRYLQFIPMQCCRQKNLYKITNATWEMKISFKIWTFKNCFLFVFLFTLFENDQNKSHFCITLFKIFIFCPKIQLWFSMKLVDFLVEKLVKMLWFWTF